MSGRTLWLGGTDVAKTREASQFNPLPRATRFITDAGVKSFEDFKGGKYKIISFHAKRARGLMVRWAVQHKARKVADLRKFDLEGYALAESASTPQRLVFRRRLED